MDGGTVSIYEFPAEREHVWGYFCSGCERYITVAEMEADDRPWGRLPGGVWVCPDCAEP